MEFLPAITDTTYRGEWTARNELTITFVTPVLGRPYYEHIQRHRYSVGTGEVLYCTALHCVWCDCGCVAHCAGTAHTHSHTDSDASAVHPSVSRSQLANYLQRHVCDSSVTR